METSDRSRSTLNEPSALADPGRRNLIKGSLVTLAAAGGAFAPSIRVAAATIQLSPSATLASAIAGYGICANAYYNDTIPRLLEVDDAVPDSTNKEDLEEAARRLESSSQKGVELARSIREVNELDQDVRDSNPELAEQINQLVQAVNKLDSAQKSANAAGDRAKNNPTQENINALVDAIGTAAQQIEAVGVILNDIASFLGTILETAGELVESIGGLAVDAIETARGLLRWVGGLLGI